MTTRAALSLRISVTDRCTLRCSYCVPPAEAAPGDRAGGVLSLAEITRFVRAAAARFDVSKVHLTGGEPLLRPGIVDLVRTLARAGAPDLALTTNGQRLGEMAEALAAAGLARVNVSLDTLDPTTFAELTGGGPLDRTLEGIDRACGAGFAPVKINTVVVRGRNDAHVTELARFAFERGCRIRFIELMPIGCVRAGFDRQFVSAAETRERLEESFRLTPLPYQGTESSRAFLAAGADGLRGTVGFIAATSTPFCGGCTRLRLTSRGRLIQCLARGEGDDIRPLLASDEPATLRGLQELIARLLQGKTGRCGFATPRSMVSVGG